MKLLSRVRLFATPWTVAHQAPQSMGFSRQEYWNGLPFPSSGDLPDPGIEPWSPALYADALPSEPLGKSLKQSKPLIYSSSLLFIVNNDASGFISVFFVSKLPVLILCTSYPSFLIYNILVIYFSILSGCPANRVSFGTEETASLYAVGFPEEYETFGLYAHLYHGESLPDCLDTAIHAVSLGEREYCCCSLHATLFSVRKRVGQDMPLGSGCFPDLR